MTKIVSDIVNDLLLDADFSMVVEKKGVPNLRKKIVVSELQKEYEKKEAEEMSRFLEMADKGDYYHGN